MSKTVKVNLEYKMRLRDGREWGPGENIAIAYDDAIELGLVEDDSSSPSSAREWTQERDDPLLISKEEREQEIKAEGKKGKKQDG